ncbi:hypothetical protein DL96DRAFT_1625943 [Flagelloscypha sp. PMI_526]|nr:hypothetical protein DL96DRAFT_1625943 [Flagelloscypha sp. PMI_526]
MIKWLKIIHRWSSTALKSILSNLTLYPLLHELSTKPHLSQEYLEYHADSLNKRSKMVMNGFFAMIGFTWSASPTPSKSGILLPLSFLLWCMITRAYYEGLPFDEFQKRVQTSTPMLVALLYAIPEVYQVFFIIYHVVLYGRWTGFAVLVVVVLIKIFLHSVASVLSKNREKLLPW